jgi:hypothetical protein
VEIASFPDGAPARSPGAGAGGARNWTFDSGAAALQLAFAGDVPLGEFFLEDGTLIYENRETGATERLDSLSLALQWPSVRQPLPFRGSGIWRGEQVRLSAMRRRRSALSAATPRPWKPASSPAPSTWPLHGEAADPNNPQIPAR